MSLNRQNILGIRVATDSKEKVLEYIQKYLSISPKPDFRNSKLAVKPLVIVTPNPEQIIYAHTHQQFADILNQADVALPDGIGIALASRFHQLLTVNSKQLTVKKRIPGVEFMEDLVQLAVERGDRIGLIGGYHGLAVRTFECLRVKHPKLDGWAEDGPEMEVSVIGNRRSYMGKKSDIPYTNPDIRLFDDEEQYFSRIVEKIGKTGVRIVLVGLGAPKQEYFIARLSSWFMVHGKKDKKNQTMNPLILMSVGGSFDIITGRLKRAPLFIRKIGFEWAWRLFQEPWRWRRQLALLKFVWLVLWERLSGRAR